MTLRLLSLSIDPKAGGLRLPEVHFGDFLTHVHGDNGSGKTAVMCALYWTLGGARQVEEPIWGQCTGSRLMLRAATGQIVTLFRAFSDRMNATIEIDGRTTPIHDEATWSATLLPLLGMKPREWTAKSGGSVGAYLSVVLPAFAIDQDKGWILPYSPFSGLQFVKDQSEEVTRMLLGLPKRHDAKRDGQRKMLMDKLEALSAAISMHDQALSSFSKVLPSDLQPLGHMLSAREKLIGDFQQFDSVVSSISAIDATLHQQVSSAVAARDLAARDLTASRQRRAVLEKLAQDGSIDLELVGTNEIAADAFRRFCGNPACQFFAGTSQPNSYGRRVLYLRDQFKDITLAMDAVDGVLADDTARLVEAEKRLSVVRHEYDAATRAKASDRVVIAMNALTTQLARVSRHIALSEQMVMERDARGVLEQQRAAIHADVSNHDATDSRRRKSVAGAAKKLGDATNRWLTVLKANEGGEIRIDDDLRVTVAGRVLTDTKGPSGSSRGRLILAYHAALLEISLHLEGDHPPVLLFDAPKQHELDPADFTAYLAELRRVFAEKGVQIVMSSRTEMTTAVGDVVWQPSHPGEKHAWYLGRDEKRPEST